MEGECGVVVVKDVCGAGGEKYDTSLQQLWDSPLGTAL